MRYLKFIQNIMIIILTFFVILNHYAYGTSEPLHINRSNYDVFNNPTCGETSAGCSNCMTLNALCTNLDDQPNCLECTCSGHYKTYLPYVGCVKDKSILFLPVKNNSFMIQKAHGQGSEEICITYDTTSDNISATKCNLSDPWQQWTWTRDEQLLHVKTSKCIWLGLPYMKNTWYLGLEECNISRKQKWKCEADYFLRTFLNPGVSLMYMTHESGTGNIFSKTSTHFTRWKRYQSMSQNRPICLKEFGCNEFTNPASPILVINTNCQNFSCQGEQQIANLSDATQCFIVWEQLQFLNDENSWKQLHVTQRNIFEIIYSRNLGISLKWDLARAPIINKVIKLSFYCAALKQLDPPPEMIRCVVIKLKWAPAYNRTVSSTAQPRPTASSTTRPTASSTGKPTASSTTFPKTSHKTPTFRLLSPTSTYKITSPKRINTPTNPTIEKEQQKGESSNVVGMVVGLVVAVLVLCGLILGCIIYKKRSRLDDKTSPNVAMHGKGHLSGNTLNPIYSSADKNNPSFNNAAIYQEPGLGASQECDLYEAGDDHEYDYAKIGRGKKPVPLSPEIAYDYAKNDDVRSAILRIPVGSNDYQNTNMNYDASMNTKEDTDKEAEYAMEPVYHALECE